MKPQSKLGPWRIGRTSLALFFGSNLWLLLVWVLTVLPRDNDFGSLLSWLGLLVGFGYMFVGIAMLLPALVTGIIAVSQNKGRTEGIVTLAGLGIMVMGVIIWLFR